MPNVPAQQAAAWLLQQSSMHTCSVGALSYRLLSCCCLGCLVLSFFFLPAESPPPAGALLALAGRLPAAAAEHTATVTTSAGPQACMMLQSIACCATCEAVDYKMVWMHLLMTLCCSGVLRCTASYASCRHCGTFTLTGTAPKLGAYRKICCTVRACWLCEAGCYSHGHDGTSNSYC